MDIRFCPHLQLWFQIKFLYHLFTHLTCSLCEGKDIRGSQTETYCIYVQMQQSSQTKTICIEKFKLFFLFVNWDRKMCWMTLTIQHDRFTYFTNCDLKTYHMTFRMKIDLGSITILMQINLSFCIIYLPISHAVFVKGKI